MKKKRKGFTTLELLICFIIIGAISVGMFTIVMNFKERQQIESIHGDILTYKYSLTKMIQDDILKNYITKVDSTNSKITFIFDDHQTASIEVVNNGIFYSSKSDTETPIFYPLPEIPNLTIPQAQYFVIDRVDNFVTIRIPFYHPDLEGSEYMISIIFPYAFLPT